MTGTPAQTANHRDAARTPPTGSHEVLKSRTTAFAEQPRDQPHKEPRDCHLAIVVLNYNGRNDTLECLASLPSSDARVLLVDNGSSDGTVAAVTGRFPDVRVIQTGENRGFTGGMNAGLRAALDSSATHVCVLNNDTIANADTFAVLLRHCLQHEPVAVSPLIYYQDTSDIWFSGAYLDREEGWPVHVKTRSASEAPCTPSETLTGCCLLASREVWKRVGLFDERYFLNFEDSDWSMRAKRLGVRLEVVNDATLLHGVSRSFQHSHEASILGSYYFLRNALLFRRIYMGARSGGARFLRVHVLAPTRQDLKRRHYRRAAVRALAVRDYVLGRFGRARGLPARLASRPPERSRNACSPTNTLDISTNRPRG